MDRIEVVRGLRIAWTAWWGILCVMLCVLWVRSYSRMDRISQHSIDRRYTAIDSRLGHIELVSMLATNRGSGDWKYHREVLSTENAVPAQVIRSLIGKYDIRLRDLSVEMIVPDLMLVLLSACIALLPWLRWRFSLRTLLIATTLIAVLLGLVMWAIR